MKNKLIYIFLCVALIVSAVIPATAFGAENPLIESVCVMKGRLYYCDTSANKVVIKNVTPVSETDKAKEFAKDLEYIETPVSPDALWTKDGVKAGADWLNNYADDEVWFVAVKLNDGNYRILYLKFV